VDCGLSIGGPAARRHRPQGVANGQPSTFNR
jgi:hypothetical protein